MAIVACLVFAAQAHAQTGTVMPSPKFQGLDASGAPCAACLLYTYEAGTTTPLATYSDVNLSVPNANPVVLDSAGRATVFLSATSYKFVLQTSAGVTIWTQDNVSAVPGSSGNLDVAITAGEALTAGDAIYMSDGSGAKTTGRWYKADATNTYSSSVAGPVGIVTTDVASAASGTVRMAGRYTALSGLTAGGTYYASGTAGALTATPPTNARCVGKAESTTTLIMPCDVGVVRLPDSDGTNSIVVRTSSNLTADRLLTLVPGDAARTVTISGDATISQDYSTTGTPVFGGLSTTPLNASQLSSGTVPSARLAVGSIVQTVAATYAMAATSSSATFADTGLTASITPSSSSNKVLVSVCQNGVGKDTSDTRANIRVLRGASTVIATDASSAQTGSTASNFVGSVCFQILDAPSTASSVTYKTQFASNGGGATAFVQTNSSTSTIVLQEITQ